MFRADHRSGEAGGRKDIGGPGGWPAGRSRRRGAAEKRDVSRHCFARIGFCGDKTIISCIPNSQASVLDSPFMDYTKLRV